MFCHFFLALFAFVVLDLVSSVLRQEIACEEERLPHDLFYVVGRETFTEFLLEQWRKKTKGQPADSGSYEKLTTVFKAIKI